MGTLFCWYPTNTMPHHKGQAANVILTLLRRRLVGDLESRVGSFGTFPALMAAGSIDSLSLENALPVDSSAT